MKYCLKSAGSILTQLSTLPADQHPPMLTLLLQCLKVIHGCMTFDFAARFDETEENVANNPVPVTWSAIFLNDTMLQPIFDVVFNIRSEEHQILVIIFILSSHLILIGTKNRC